MTPPMAFVVYEKALEHGNRFVIPHNDEPVRQACKWLVENGYVSSDPTYRSGDGFFSAFLVGTPKLLRPYRAC